MPSVSVGSGQRSTLQLDGCDILSGRERSSTMGEDISFHSSYHVLRHHKNLVDDTVCLGNHFWSCDIHGTTFLHSKCALPFVVAIDNPDCIVGGSNRTQI